MPHDQRDPFRDGVSRRTFIKATGAGAVAILGGSLYATAPAAARAQRVAKVDTPLRHVVISCSENRSFDHYFGYAPQVQAAGFGPPAGYSQPDAAGNPHFPFEFTALETPDPPHSWNAIHEQFNGGAMDGFYRSSQASIGDGDAAMGFYTADQLPFYYSLLDDSALVANSSARCWARRGRTASRWPQRRRAGSRRTGCGATASSTTRSSLTCSTPQG
jgi:phospholipase C